MNSGQSDKRTKENESDKDKPERTVYRNLFERIKPDEKEKIKEEIDKKEINNYTGEENLNEDGK